MDWNDLWLSVRATLIRYYSLGAIALAQQRIKDPATRRPNFAKNKGKACKYISPHRYYSFLLKTVIVMVIATNNSNNVERIKRGFKAIKLI